MKFFDLEFCIFKDDYITNVNQVDNRLNNIEISSKTMDKIYVGRCIGTGTSWLKTCSSHLGNITDINIWNRALTQTELTGWTTCR